MLKRAVKAAPIVSTSEEMLGLRFSLPGQAGACRKIQAEAEFGLSYTWKEIEQRVIASLPRKFGLDREARSTDLYLYRRPIPDAALLRFKEAMDSGLFSNFFVVEAQYGDRAMADPWLIGRIKDSGGDDHSVGWGGQFVVLPYWD